MEESETAGQTARNPQAPLGRTGRSPGDGQGALDVMLGRGPKGR